MTALPEAPIEQALTALQKAVETTIRAEQLRDRLTGLGNDDALTELLKSSIEKTISAGAVFWVAFQRVGGGVTASNLWKPTLTRQERCHPCRIFDP